eukprot:UN10416
MIMSSAATTIAPKQQRSNIDKITLQNTHYHTTEESLISCLFTSSSSFYISA